MAAFKRLSSAALCCALLGSGVTASPATATSQDTPDVAQFQVEELLEGRYENPERESPNGEDSLGLTVLENASTGEYALTDVSLLESESEDEPAMWAASADFVDISWSPLPGISEYLVFKEDILQAQVTETSYRDVEVSPGQEIFYRIEAVLPTPESEGRTWGLMAAVPDASPSDAPEMQEALDEQVSIMATRSLATVQHQTFIPQSRLSAPRVGCSYGSSYKFGGDNRGFQASGSSRTRVQANISWANNGSMSTSKSVGATRVYNSSGKQVASRTASSSGLSVKKLALSNRTSIDLRFNVSAANPFCSASAAISAAFTMNVTRSGSWSIISGQHRQMPSHEIHIHSGTRWVSAYRRSYASATCLVNIACPTASMAGRYGSY